MNKKKIVLAIGTRPEAIKMAPVYLALKDFPGLNPQILLTGQHREQLNHALRLFEIVPDINLDVMEDRQTLPELASRIISGVANALRKIGANYVLVHGDTLTTFAVTWTAFLEGIPVGHVEAGLRSNDLHNPFPEESNRILTDALTDMAYAPTKLARENLLKEGKEKEKILVTGQTGIDAIRYASDRGKLPEGLESLNGDIITVTLHRRENWSVLPPLAEMIEQLAKFFPAINFVFPVHLNPLVQNAVRPALEKLDNVLLLDPLEYGEMAALLARSCLIITDSGGLQEEGAALGVPVAVVRDVTERPEGIEAGSLVLVGTNPDSALIHLKALISDKKILRRMSSAKNPYGDGKASKRIASSMAWRFGLVDKPIEWFAGKQEVIPQ